VFWSKHDLCGDEPIGKSAHVSDEIATVNQKKNATNAERDKMKGNGWTVCVREDSNSGQGYL
jgi:hypothetical protein